MNPEAAINLEATALPEAPTQPEANTHSQATTSPEAAIQSDADTQSDEATQSDAATQPEDPTAVQIVTLYTRTHIAAFDMNRLLAEMTKARLSHRKSEQQMKEELGAASNERCYRPDGYNHAELAAFEIERLRTEMARNGLSRFKSDRDMETELERAWNHPEVDPENAVALQRAFEKAKGEPIAHEALLVLMTLFGMDLEKGGEQMINELLACYANRQTSWSVKAYMSTRSEEPPR